MCISPWLTVNGPSWTKQFGNHGMPKQSWMARMNGKLSFCRWCMLSVPPFAVFYSETPCTPPGQRNVMPRPWDIIHMLWGIRLWSYKSKLHCSWYSMRCILLLPRISQRSSHLCCLSAQLPWQKSGSTYRYAATMGPWLSLAKFCLKTCLLLVICSTRSLSLGGIDQYQLPTRLLTMTWVIPEYFLNSFSQSLRCALWEIPSSQP